MELDNCSHYTEQPSNQTEYCNKQTNTTAQNTSNSLAKRHLKNALFACLVHGIAYSICGIIRLLSGLMSKK